MNYKHLCIKFKCSVIINVRENSCDKFVETNEGEITVKHSIMRRPDEYQQLNERSFDDKACDICLCAHMARHEVISKIKE